MVNQGEKHRRRMEQVEEHVVCENRHDLEAVMETFGDDAQYEDTAWNSYYGGRDGVRRYYEELMGALPDLRIDVKQRHVSSDHIVLEVEISGTHRGTWKGLPPTGSRVRFPLCAVYSFDAEDQLAGERIYYDRATVMRQLGVFHEPNSLQGRLLAPIQHPLTLLKAAGRSIVKKLLPS